MLNEERSVVNKDSLVKDSITFTNPDGDLIIDATLRATGDINLSAKNIFFTSKGAIISLNGSVNIQTSEQILCSEGKIDACKPLKIIAGTDITLKGTIISQNGSVNRHCSVGKMDPDKSVKAISRTNVTITCFDPKTQANEKIRFFNSNQLNHVDEEQTNVWAKNLMLN